MFLSLRFCESAQMWVTPLGSAIRQVSGEEPDAWAIRCHPNTVNSTSSRTRSRSRLAPRSEAARSILNVVADVLIIRPATLPNHLINAGGEGSEHRRSDLPGIAGQRKLSGVFRELHK